MKRKWEKKEKQKKVARRRHLRWTWMWRKHRRNCPLETGTELVFSLTVFAEQRALYSRRSKEAKFSVFVGSFTQCSQHYGRETVDGCRKKEANLSSTAANRRGREQSEGSFQPPFALLPREGPECGNETGLLLFSGSHSERSPGRKVDSIPASLLREGPQGILMFWWCITNITLLVT